MLVLRRDLGADNLDGLNGLNERSPALALLLAIFVLSLAGIPPLAGFFGKFYVFASALQGGSGMSIAVVVLALVMSAVSLYYYLLVLKRVFILPPETKDQSPPQISGLTTVLLTLLALALIFAGLFPQALLELLHP